MGIFRSRTYASRKYIDLIHEASSNLANWDPSYKLEPGDFGVINRDTGRFEKRSSIYTHEQTMAIAAKYPPILGETKAYKQVFSRRVRALDLDIDHLANVSGLADAYIKLQIQFGSTRGAALIMHEPRTSYVPEELLEEFACKRVECLKGMVLITDVHSCSSYALYLSCSSNESVKIALLASAPLPPCPVVSAGGNVGARWWSSAQSGMFEHGHRPSASFYPLYVARTLRKNVRRTSPSPDPNPSEAEYIFGPSEAPWNPLDEEGKETMYEEEPEDW